MRKPCPVCNSRKTRENRKYFVCENCGYILKKQLEDEDIKQAFSNPETK